MEETVTISWYLLYSVSLQARFRNKKLLGILQLGTTVFLAGLVRFVFRVIFRVAVGSRAFFRLDVADILFQPTVRSAVFGSSAVRRLVYSSAFMPKRGVCVALMPRYAAAAHPSVRGFAFITGATPNVAPHFGGGSVEFVVSGIRLCITFRAMDNES